MHMYNYSMHAHMIEEQFNNLQSIGEGKLH